MLEIIRKIFIYYQYMRNIIINLKYINPILAISLFGNPG